MWYCDVDVAYRQLSDWTRLQWALHKQPISPLSAMRGGDTLFPNYFGNSCCLCGRCHLLILNYWQI